jgi:ubiquinone/menaquinone biosynthesis C-methylase UbiE
MTTENSTFDPVYFKETTREQWQVFAEGWAKWTPKIEQWLGPATQRMLDMADIQVGQRVLDVAAGAGGSALEAAKRVGATGHVLATDISGNMLAYAQDAAAQEGLTNFATRVMDGEHLELEDATFDVALSRVGLIYFPDRHQALSELWRVLKPGGSIATIVYSTADRNQFFSVPVGIITRRTQLPPPLPGQPGAFSLGAPGVLEATFQQAGFRDIQVEIVPAPVQMPSAAEFWQFARDSYGALHQMVVGVSEAEREAIWEEAEQALQAYEGSDGFSGPCELIIGVASK